MTVGLNRLTCAALALALTAAGTAARSEALPVPLHAALLAKVLAYDYALKGRPKAAVRIGVAHTAASDNAALAAALTALGFLGEAGTVQAVLGGNYDVAVLDTQRLNAAERASLCERKMLAVGIDAAQVEQGLSALAVVAGATGKPEIVVNLAGLRACGHDLPGEVLKLARVIR